MGCCIIYEQPILGSGVFMASRCVVVMQNNLTLVRSANVGHGIGIGKIPMALMPIFCDQTFINKYGATKTVLLLI